jgi:hypothetical protein
VGLTGCFVQNPFLWCAESPIERLKFQIFRTLSQCRGRYLIRFLNLNHPRRAGSAQMADSRMGESEPKTCTALQTIVHSTSEILHGRVQYEGRERTKPVSLSFPGFSFSALRFRFDENLFGFDCTGFRHDTGLKGLKAKVSFVRPGP